MKNNKGFSLIELMVVIGIVAVLAAIAVPAYKAYRVRARLVAIVPTLEALGRQSQEYVSKKGFYPNAEQLGLGTGQFADPSLVNAAAGAVQISGDSCGASQYITFYVDTPSVFPESSYDTVFVQYFIYNVDGMAKYYKAYALGNMFDTNISDPSSYLPQGWINLNTGTAWDLSAGAASNTVLETDKTCQ